MQQRRKLIDILEEYSFAFMIVLLLVLFILGYYLFFNVVYSPLTDSQLDSCTQVAQDLYSRLEEAIVTLPGEVSATASGTTITVKHSDISYLVNVDAEMQNGEFALSMEIKPSDARMTYVTAELQNGELVIEQHMRLHSQIYESTVFSLVFACVSGIVFSIPFEIYRKCKSKFAAKVSLS